ncbi:MAG: YraN family protein [Rhodospirillales bacterium]
MMSPQKNNRQKAWLYGQAAEAICTLSLRLRGYRILARRFKTPLGEIDIIARRRIRIAFIEVKARQDLEQAAHSIGEQQQKRIARAAELFMQRHAALAQCHLRFDAMLIAPWRIPRHIRDAWRI